MAVPLSIALVVLVSLAALPSLWIFVGTAILLIAWLRRTQPVQARPSTGTFLSLALYAGLIAIVLVTLRAALGWLERPTIPLEQTGIVPYLARGSLGFYDKSELRLALAQLLVLWVLFATLLAEMWGRRASAPSLHPLTAVFALVLYFGSIQPPPYTSSLGQSIGLMFGQLIAGAAMFVLVRRLTSRALALLGASCVLLLAPVSEWSAAPETAALYWVLTPGLAFVAHNRIRELSIQVHRRWGASIAAARGFVPLALCLLFNVLFPLDRLNERIASYATRYEPAREAWYRECARGGSCDPAAKPSLAAALREASP